MKKQIYYSLFFLIFSMHIVDAKKKDAVLELDPEYMKTLNEVTLLREKWRRIDQLILGGTVAGGTVGLLGGLGRIRYGFKPTMTTTGIVASSPLIGGALGLALGTALDKKTFYTIRKINIALQAQAFTTYDFMKMPIDEAVMVYATYQKNLPLMKKMKPYVKHFLKDKRARTGLARLYFGEATPENIETLKEMLK